MELSLRERFASKGMKEKREMSMIESLRSPLAFKGRRAKKKLLDRARKRPLDTVTALLRNYDSDNERVRAGVLDVLTDISRTEWGMTAILEDIVHPSRNVRKAVLAFLGAAVGAHAVTYAAFYEQTMLLVAMAQRKDIPTDDIISLAEQSKRTFVEGSVMDAVRDIGFCLDHVKHRYRSSEQLKDYVTELLRMAPDLTRIGVYTSTIEEPLRKAMKASRYRRYDETRELVEVRFMEAQLRSSLARMGKMVAENINERPKVNAADLSVEDLSVLSELYELVDTVTSLILADKKGEAVSSMIAYLDITPVKPTSLVWRRRVEEKDPSALYTLYTVFLLCIKLASSLIPASAEDIYQERLRLMEGAPIVHLVLWPVAVMRHLGAKVGSEGAEAAPSAPI